MRTSMDRRSFIKGAALTAAVGAAGAVGGTLAGCSEGTAGSAGDKRAPQAKDGTYEASSHGFLADVTVKISVKGGLVEEVSIADMGETPDRGGKAARVLQERILEAKGLDGVDAVTGATATSRAVFRATEDCLIQAGALEEPGETTCAPASTWARRADSTG